MAVLIYNYLEKASAFNISSILIIYKNIIDYTSKKVT